MIHIPPPPPVRHFTVSRVWPCSSCGYLARSNISSAACPSCGNIGLEESNKRLQSGPQGLSTDSALSEAAKQDEQTLTAGLPDPSTLFIPAAEFSDEISVDIRNCLGANASVDFGEFPDDLFGSSAAGYLIRAHQSVTMQEMADLANFLNSPRADNSVADDDLSSSHLRSLDLGEFPVGGISPPRTTDGPDAGILANVSATPNSQAEQHEDWEIIDRSRNDNKDLQAASSETSAPDIKSNDSKVLEPLDTRYSLIAKPQRFFKVGRVFMTLWSEPASSTARDGPNFSSSTIGGRIFSETRRFVVVRSGHGYSLCCPIQTYQKRGTTKSHTNLDSHAIVYVAGSEPKLLPEEEWPRMGNFPVVVEDKSVTIDQSSRLNFGKVYTVEHNIKVRNVGKISKELLPRLKASLVKSMGVNVSDGEPETGTETEDNVSRPTTIEAHSNLRSDDKKSSSSSEAQNSSSPGLTTASSGRNSFARKSLFFIASEGIDREVITTDICRYLGNDALVRPGVHQDPITRISQDGFYITAYRPPTSEQLRDLRADSAKWREERRSNSSPLGGYDQSATRQEATMRVNLDEPRPQLGHPNTSYPQLQPSANPTLGPRPQDYPTVRVGFRNASTMMAPPALPSYRNPGYQPSEPNYSYTAPQAQESGFSIMDNKRGRIEMSQGQLWNVQYDADFQLSGAHPLAGYPPTRPPYSLAEPGNYDPYGPRGVQHESPGDYYGNEEELMDCEDPPAQAIPPPQAQAQSRRERERDSRERHDELRRKGRRHR